MRDYSYRKWDTLLEAHCQVQLGKVKVVAV